jgi:hypothetical protein
MYYNKCIRHFFWSGFPVALVDGRTSLPPWSPLLSLVNRGDNFSRCIHRESRSSATLYSVFYNDSMWFIAKNEVSEQRYELIKNTVIYEGYRETVSFNQLRGEVCHAWYQGLPSFNFFWD